MHQPSGINPQMFLTMDYRYNNVHKCFAIIEKTGHLENQCYNKQHFPTQNQKRPLQVNKITQEDLQENKTRSSCSEEEIVSLEEEQEINQYEVSAEFQQYADGFFSSEANIQKKESTVYK